jgi:glucans biosynthesis protein
MNRREFVLVVGGAAVGVIAKGALGLTQEAAGGFNRDKVVELARTLATKEFDPPSEVPELFGKLGYDQYRDIRFRRELGFWTGEHSGFSLDLLHAGFIYKSPVEVCVVEAGTSIPVRYTSQLFDFGTHLKVPPLHDQALFSGIRLRAPIHTPNRMDEFVVFQDAGPSRL